MKRYEGRKIGDYKLLIHDEGEPLLRQVWPPTPQGLKEATIRELVDYPFDAYSYGINAACGAYHPSRVYDRLGDGVSLFKDTGTWKISETIRRMEAQGIDPTALIIEACHDINLDVNIRIRMNDLHDIFSSFWEKPDFPPKVAHEPGWYYMASFKKEHPEMLLGQPVSEPKNQGEVETYALNYALAPVRERQYRFIEETVNTYDLDAVTLDFMRWPYLFKKEEAYAQRHLMTDYMKRIRACVKDAAERRGRPIHFIVRLPDTIETALRMGIDVATWLAEGLLDLVIIGAGYNPFDTPWKEITDKARRYGVPVLATIRSSGEPPHYGGDTVELYYRKLRAATIRAYRQGVVGLELFNYFYHQAFYGKAVGGSGAGTGYDFTYDIVNPQRLLKLPRTYEVSRQSPVDYIYGHATFPGQLPCTISRSEDGLAHTVTLDVPERISEDTRVSLWLQLIDLGHEHELEVCWNGRKLPFDVETDWHRKGSLNLGDVVFALTPEDLREGENRLSLRLLKRPANLDHFVTLTFALLHIDP